MASVVHSTWEAPDPEYTQVVCNYTGSGYFCDAWPKLGGVSYSWSKHGMLSFVSPPYLDDYAEVICSPSSNNKIHLTVTSPYGMSTTVVSDILYCGASGEY